MRPPTTLLLHAIESSIENFVLYFLDLNIVDEWPTYDSINDLLSYTNESLDMHYFTNSCDLERQGAHDLLIQSYRSTKRPT